MRPSVRQAASRKRKAGQRREVQPRLVGRWTVHRLSKYLPYKTAITGIIGAILGTVSDYNKTLESK